MVVEVIGAGFDRPSNGNFLSLRFPRIVKVHEDRSIQDALDFDEYQRLALENIKGLGEYVTPTESPALSVYQDRPEFASYIRPMHRITEPGPLVDLRRTYHHRTFCQTLQLRTTPT